MSDRELIEAREQAGMSDHGVGHPGYRLRTGTPRPGTAHDMRGGTVHYRVLGPIEVSRDGVPIDLGGAKQRAVLAALLLSPGRVVSTSTLIDAVWGEGPPASAHASLQVLISNLRRRLRDGSRSDSPISRVPPGYRFQLDPQDVLDTAVFDTHVDSARNSIEERRFAEAVDSAQQALTVARGPLAAEFTGEVWVLAAAGAVAERRRAARDALITGLLGTDRVADAVAAAAVSVAEDPLSERACWLHTIALYRAGRTAEALDAFRSYAETLGDELGLDPTPALRDLQSAVLRQDPDLAQWPPRASTPAASQQPSGLPTSPVPTATTVPVADREAFIGRSDELGVVGDVLRASLDQSTGWLVISGPAGIGKTRLAEEAISSWQHSGGQVVRTACPDDVGTPSWWPIRQMLRSQGLDPDAVLTPPPDVDADDARFVVYESVRAAVIGMAGRVALMIVVDDVQWADDATLRFMRYVAEAERSLPLAVIVTVRDGEGGVELHRLLAAVARRPGSRRVTLGPLSSSEVAELAAQVSGEQLDGVQAAELAERTGGNPFFVSEYARLPAIDRIGTTIPEAVRAVLARRIAALEPAAAPLLRTAAVLGDPLDLDVLATVAGMDPDTAADLLDAAVDRRILGPSSDGTTYTFTHALLRDEVLGGVPVLRRRRLHLAAAKAIGEAASGERLARRIGHLIAALPLSDVGETVAACRAAALAGEQQWQYDAAARWWGMALHAIEVGSAGHAVVTDREQLVVARVAALAHSGRGQTVLDTLDAELLDAAREGRFASVGRLAATLLRTTGSWPWAAYGTDPAPLLARLAGIVDLVAADPTAQARVLAALAVGSCYDPDASVPNQLSRRALRLADSAGDPDTVADALLARLLLLSGVASTVGETFEVAERLEKLPHRLARVDDVLRHNLLSMAAMTVGRFDDAAEHVRQGELGSDLLRMPVSRVQLRWAGGMLALWHGHVEQAESQFRHAAGMHRQTELYEAGSYALARLALDWNTGRLAGPPSHPTAGPPLVTLWLRLFRRVSDSDPERDELITAAVANPPTLDWLSHSRLVLLAHAVADRGLVGLVPALRDQLEPYSGLVATLGQVGVFGTVDTALARLAELAGDRPSAERYLSRAADLARRGAGPLELSRCEALQRRLGMPFDGPTR